MARVPVDIEGATVAERRARATPGTAIDDLRRVLCFEPRGHADMYGGFITPPDNDGADFGVLFWHKDGFSTACGHGTIALGAWAIENGVLPPDSSGLSTVTIDVPSGRVQAMVHHPAGPVIGVDFVNVPSYLIAQDVLLETSRGSVSVDIAFGGAIYAQVNAAHAGLSVEPASTNELIGFGREVKQQLIDSEFAKHPTDSRLDGIYGTILFEDLGNSARPRRCSGLRCSVQVEDRT
ncbi:proline racemase family protein, partial [Phytohabitans kaempferiae]